MDQIWHSTVFGQRKSKLVALQKLASAKGKTGVESSRCKKRKNSTISIKISSSKNKSRNKKTKDSSETSQKYSREKFLFEKTKAKSTDSNSGQKTDVLSLAKAHRPRCVLFHPLRIPSISKLRRMSSRKSETCNQDRNLGIHRWQEGDMLWGKIRGYPFWPCMVSKDPFTKQFTKVFGCLKSARSYHVQFFGAEAERSWIKEASLLEFEGRDKFIDIIQYGLENPDRSSKPPREFKVSPAWYPTWTLAVSEAEGAFKLTREARIGHYTFQYMIVKGDDKKPVDDLLKTIEQQSGFHERTDEEDSDDNNSLYNQIFDTKHERQWLDSDDMYSSDDSSVPGNKPRKCPMKIKLRIGLLEVFLAKHTHFVQDEHPDWSKSEITDHLKHQWSMMSDLQKSRYTSRHQQPVFLEVKKSRRQVSERSSDDSDDEEDVDPHMLDLQILKLSKKLGEFIKVCHICENQGSDLTCCAGSCGRHFHLACVKQDKSYALLCQECSSGAHECFACKMSGSDTVKCTWQECRKYYHKECVEELSMASIDKDGFTCPLHVCATCAVEGNPAVKEGPFTECVRCPVAYHASDFCLVPGCQVLGERRLVCASHFQPSRSRSQHSRVNVRWCLSCGNGGSLLMCHKCPAAYHEKCRNELSVVKQATLNISAGSKAQKTGKELWLCSDCCQGRRSLYGDIVWIKFGFYRWWPGEVCHPQHVPKVVQEKQHQLGQFPVRFFGGHDFAWVHHGRVIAFDRWTKMNRSAVTSSLDKVFIRGVREATVASKLCASIRRMLKQPNSQEHGQKQSVTDFQMVYTSTKTDNIYIKEC